MRKMPMFATVVWLSCMGLFGHAQTKSSPQPPAKADAVSALKPPAGAKVAIVEFDDLECPSCAHAVPIIEKAAAQYKIPVVHHDYPLTEIHVWSFDAAVTAR